MTHAIFSGSLRPYPGLSPVWDERQRLIAEEILGEITAAALDAPLEADPGADIEDFWEDACRMSAAMRAVNHLELAPEMTSWTEAELKLRLGPVSTLEEGGHHAADRLLTHPLALKHAGREMQLVTLSPSDAQVEDGATDLAAWMAYRASQGDTHIILKNAERKGGVWKIPTSIWLDMNRHAVLDALDWTAVRLEGVRDAFLAQPFIDMRWEYRCFVVDGEVVTAAGNIEEHTPLDADPEEGPFQVMLREHRGHHASEHNTQGGISAVTRQPEIAAELLEFARRVARELPADQGTVTIDVAMSCAPGAAGKPVVVEFNEVPNSGLFASDVWTLYRRLSNARDRGYGIINPALALVKALAQAQTRELLSR